MLYNGHDMTWHYLWESEKKGWPQATGASRAQDDREHQRNSRLTCQQKGGQGASASFLAQRRRWAACTCEGTVQNKWELLPEFQTLEPRLRSFQWEHLWCSRRLILPKRIETQEARRRLNGGYRLQQRLNTQGQRSQTWNEDALLKSTSRSSRSKKEPHSSLCGSAW